MNIYERIHDSMPLASVIGAEVGIISIIWAVINGKDILATLTVTFALMSVVSLLVGLVAFTLLIVLEAFNVSR